MAARKWATSAAALAVMCAASIAWGDSVMVEDPAEGYEIDAVAAQHRHPRVAPATLVAHDVRTAAEWSSMDLVRARMKLRLIGGDGPKVRFVELHPMRDGSLRGVFVDRSRFYGHVFAWRPDTSTLRVEFARALLDGARAYRWSIRLYQPCDEEQGVCAVEWDRVPDEGSILHRLR